MSAPKVTFCLATAELARAYYGGDPPFTFRGYVAMLDDRPVGVGGVYFINDQPWAFSEMKPELRPRRKDKARAVRLLERSIAAYRTPVHAAASEPTSEGLLTRLGFLPTGQTVAQGPVFVRFPNA